MGYVNDTQSSMLIPVGKMQFNTGVWSDAVAANQWSKSKTAVAETTTVRIPIEACRRTQLG